MQQFSLLGRFVSCNFQDIFEYLKWLREFSLIFYFKLVFGLPFYPGLVPHLDSYSPSLDQVVQFSDSLLLRLARLQLSYNIHSSRYFLILAVVKEIFLGILLSVSFGAPNLSWFSAALRFVLSITRLVI
jgi:hypothetical protein